MSETFSRLKDDASLDLDLGVLEDRIGQLCVKALTAPDDKLDPIIKELQAALHEHHQRLRQLVAQKLGPDKLNQRSRYADRHRNRGISNGAIVAGSGRTSIRQNVRTTGYYGA